MAAPTPTFTLPSRPLTWFITGCSSGFGLALARLVLAHKHHLVASSRNPARTPELVREVEAQGGRWVALDVDAADSASVLEGLGVDVDVLVNNAGFGLYGAAEQFSEAEARSLFDTLFFAPYRLTRAVVPAMRARRFGIVVNISSAAAVGHVPTMAVYGAAKAALDSESCPSSRARGGPPPLLSAHADRPACPRPPQDPGLRGAGLQHPHPVGQPGHV